LQSNEQQAKLTKLYSDTTLIREPWKNSNKGANLQSWLCLALTQQWSRTKIGHMNGMKA